MINDFVALDIETTGLNPAEDEIIEIGAIKYIDGKETDKLELFVRPEGVISDRITEITGITAKMVEDAERIGDVIERVIEFSAGYPLLGHNIIFDYSFLKVAAEKNGIKYTTKGIDTYKLAKKYINFNMSKSLESLCGFYGIETIHHRALADAESAAAVYYKILEMAEPESVEEDLMYSIPKKEPLTWKQKSFLESLIKRYGIEFDRQIESLTKSEASKAIDNIISTHGRA